MTRTFPIAIHKILILSSLTLTIVACGGGGSENTPPVIEVPPVTNNAPTISPVSFSVDEDTQLKESITATDQDGDSLSYSLMSDVSNGTVVLLNDGSFEYQPTDNFYGEDSTKSNCSAPQ